MIAKDVKILKQIDIQHRIFYLKNDSTRYFCPETKVDEGLIVRGVYYIPMIQKDRLPENWKNEKLWRFLPYNQLYRIERIEHDTLNGPYSPASDLEYAYTMNLITPDSMDDKIKESLRQLRQAVGNVAEFVAERLNYSLFELSQVLSNEQIDGVALAIYNAEARNQGMIVGDQTGVGKGRMAAAFLRYAVEHGKKPIFFTKTPELFPDIIRDLKAIHCHYKLFTTNASGSDGKKLKVLDDDGSILLEYNKKMYDEAVKKNVIPKDCQVMLCTYSQIIEKSKKKVMFIEQIAKDNIIVCDEAHDAGGDITKSYTRKDENGNIDMSSPIIKGFTAYHFLNNIIPNCKSIMYLSATFAKRPDNMPLYAIRTCFVDAFPDAKDMNSQRIQDVFRYGGNAVEEISSTTLVEYGQMVRRERLSDDVKTEFITLNEDGARKYSGIQNEVERHKVLFENVLAIIKKMRQFEMDYIDPYIEYLNHEVFVESKEERNTDDEKEKKKWRDIRYAKMPLWKNEDGQRDEDMCVYCEAKRTTQLTRRLFDIINVVLFSLKAEAVGNRAVYYLKNGCKPVVGFSSTLDCIMPNPPKKGQSIDDIDLDNDDDSEENTSVATNDEDTMTYGSEFDADLMRKFKNIVFNFLCFKTRHRRKENKIYEASKTHVKVITNDIIDWKLFDNWCAEKEPFMELPSKVYQDLQNTIASNYLGIPVSPIDVIRKIIEDAGFSVAECTGRKNQIDYIDNSFKRGVFNEREKKSTSQCYNEFNDNEADCLFINATGSTGKSAHAIATKKVPESEVKRRVLIIAQAESDINDEIQKRGRINRTGQLKHIPPIIEYIFSSLPAERKMMMRLKKKLRSLTANTSADQDADSDKMSGDDIYNTFGDSVALKLFKANWFDENQMIWENAFMDNPLKVKWYQPKKEEEPGYYKSYRSASGFAQTAFSRIQMLPIQQQEEFFSDFDWMYSNTIARAKENGVYFLEAEDRDYQAVVINEYCLRQGSNDKSRFGSSTFMTHLSIKSQKKLPKSSEIGVDLVDHSEKILAYINTCFNEAQKETETNVWETKNDKIDTLNAKIATKQSTIERLKEKKKIFADDLDSDPEDLKKVIKDIADTNEEIKKLQSDIDNIDTVLQKSIDDRHNEQKARLIEITNIIKALKVGTIYRGDDGNLMMVSKLSALYIDSIEDTSQISNLANYFSRQSDIYVEFVTTDTELDSGIKLNLADTDEKRAEISKIINNEKVPMSEWDDFINSDKFREKVYIITGNVIPYISNALKGAIVHYTMSDGTSDIGFQVKMERDPQTNRLQLPVIVNGVSILIEKYKTEIRKAIVNSGEINFVNKTELFSSGKGCYIKSERINEKKIKFYLVYSKRYYPFFDWLKDVEELDDKPELIEGEFRLKFNEDALDSILDGMNQHDFTAKIPFHLIDQYGIELGGEKYQMREWKPLSYDKNKIPKQPKNYLHKLFVKL